MTKRVAEAHPPQPYDPVRAERGAEQLLSVKSGNQKND